MIRCLTPAMALWGRDENAVLIAWKLHEAVAGPRECHLKSLNMKALICNTGQLNS